MSALKHYRPKIHHFRTSTYIVTAGGLLAAAYAVAHQHTVPEPDGKADWRHVIPGHNVRKARRKELSESRLRAREEAQLQAPAELSRAEIFVAEQAERSRRGYQYGVYGGGGYEAERGRDEAHRGGYGYETYPPRANSFERPSVVNSRSSSFDQDGEYYRPPTRGRRMDSFDSYRDLRDYEPRQEVIYEEEIVDYEDDGYVTGMAEEREFRGQGAANEYYLGSGQDGRDRRGPPAYNPRDYRRVEGEF